MVYTGKVINAAVGGIITNADGTSIKIPAGALASDKFLCARVMEQLFNLPRSYKYRDTVNPIGRDFGELDMTTNPWTIKPVTFLKPVKITIPYNKSDVGNIEDESLRIFYCDTINGNYYTAGANQSVKIGAPGVNGTITADVSHFSTYRIVGSYVSTNLDSVNAYPNPFNPGTAFGSVFKVLNIPTDCELTIYTISGEKVKTLKETDMTAPNSGWIEWDGKNESGEVIAQGVYVYVLKSPDGSKKIGKIGLVK